MFYDFTGHCQNVLWYLQELSKNCVQYEGYHDYGYSRWVVPVQPWNLIQYEVSELSSNRD